jgi:hypothetical protein
LRLRLLLQPPPVVRWLLLPPELLLLLPDGVELQLLQPDGVDLLLLQPDGGGELLVRAVGLLVPLPLLLRADDFPYDHAYDFRYEHFRYVPSVADHPQQ